MATAQSWALQSNKDLSLLPARLALGSSMAYHGYGKLAGEGPTTTAQMFEQLGIKPGRFWAVASGAAELLAAGTMLLGFGTRIGAAAVLVTQAVAIAKVHAPKGYAVTQGGFEYNLALIGIALGTLIAGPGRYSGHEAIEHALEGRGPRRFLQRRRPSAGMRWLKLLR